VEYDASQIVVLPFDESVRQRPGMYFRVAFDSPRFGLHLLEAIAANALHPPGLIGPPRHTARSTIEIVGDRSLVVTLSCPQDPAWYDDQPLGPAWMSLAAADVVSDRSVVLVGPDELEVELDLDPTYVGADFTFPTVFDGLDPHWPTYCQEPPGTGSVLLRDLRGGLREVTYL
jgi:hypothetical protein